jgi:hypothetical protein
MTRDLELPLPDLGLSAAEADERFARLQARLISLWKSIQAFNVQEDGGVVEERIAGRDFSKSERVSSSLATGRSRPTTCSTSWRGGLGFDQTRQTGVVFHMMSALSEHGRVGLTAVGDSHAEADRFYTTAQAALDEEATAALAPRPLPPA